jgi:hypothetical protein
MKIYPNRLLTLLFILTMVFSFEVFGQGRILADGNPPLTSQMIDHFVSLMEWSLGVEFSANDKAAAEKEILAYWQKKDEKEIKAVLNILDFEKNLSNASETKKREIQPQLKKQLLETMEKDSSDRLNVILLAIYKKNIEANSVAGDLGSFIGTWQVLHANSIVGVDINSGRIGDGNAMIAQWEIKPNGGVIYSFILQQANFGCTTRVKTSKTGTAIISGSKVTFDYNGGTTVSEDNCNRNNNYTKKLYAEKETFDFKLGRDSSGKSQFCFANSKLKDCAVKVK